MLFAETEVYCVPSQLPSRYPEVVDHYTHFWRVEQSAFDNYVTDWERKRYFERI